MHDHICSSYGLCTLASLGGHNNSHLLKNERKTTCIADLYQNHERRMNRPGKRRIRQVSVSQVIQESSVRGFQAVDGDVLVTFPSFKQAGTRLDRLLERENQLAQFNDAQEDDHEWGIDCSTIDRAVRGQKKHCSVMTYSNYATDSVVQQIYQDLPNPEGQNILTATKSAHGLLFGNYKDGTYRKIVMKRDTCKDAELEGWTFATFRHRLRRFFLVSINANNFLQV